MSYPSYNITTIRELVDVATPENLPLLLADLCNFIILAKSQEEYNMTVNTNCFTWINDGETDLILTCINNDLSKDTIMENLPIGAVYDEVKNEIIVESPGFITDKVTIKLPDTI